MKDSLFWSFSLPGSMQVNYLFGTMHLKNSDAYSLADLIIPYIEKCHTYAAETDMNGILESNMITNFKFEYGINLTHFIKKKKLERMRRIIFKSFNVDIFNYLDFKPIFISNLITEIILHSDNPVSLDQHLWNEANNLVKFTTGVETVESQMNTFKEISLEFQLKQLKDICRNVNKFRKTLKKLSLSYKNQDINKLYKVSKKAMGALKYKLIYERNSIMTQNILKLSNNHATFISIGAAHLAGKHGVLRLLKDQNCILKPIFLK